MNPLTPISTPSSVSSASHSQPQSPHAHDNDGELIARALGDTHLEPPSSANHKNKTKNGLLLPEKPPKAAKPPFRFSRMFSQTGRSSHRDQPASSRTSDAGSETGLSTVTDGGKSTTTTASSSKPPITQPSIVSQKPPTKPPPSTMQAEKKGKEPAQPHKRYETNSSGTHEHFLKSARRQEKLTDMLWVMLGGGKKKEEPPATDEQQLSLVSNWVDQLKNEKEKLAADKEKGPNSTASLVEKYGKCHEVVGRGAFGIVRISHKVDPKDSKTEHLYAVKEFRRRPQETFKKYQKRLTSEFCISSSLRHPNIIHTLDLMQDAKGDYCEVMEYCSGGDLYTLILSAGKLEVGEADCFFKQLMRGVEYMHEMGVAHRDLKPENLLLTTHGAIKITDFGNGECFRMAWEKEAHMTAGLCGSAPYIAPEEYFDSEFDPRAVDIWATGVIYMAMRTGRHLWRQAQKDEDEFYERYLEDRKDEDGYAPIETLHRVCWVFLHT
ncbi:serine/threonine-protein kinase HAL4/sat4 [Myotisia sp. PD_48]|nr:serine/threonine-protein kinase HAL4/sat4 [Myotisia sp. PD_48]